MRFRILVIVSMIQSFNQLLAKKQVDGLIKIVWVREREWNKGDHRDSKTNGRPVRDQVWPMNP